MKKLIAVFVIALAAILAARLSFFTVEEGRAALVLEQIGGCRGDRARASCETPGPH